jgi:hypothetical protein
LTNESNVALLQHAELSKKRMEKRLLVKPLPKGHDPFSVFGLPMVNEISISILVGYYTITPKEIAQFATINKAWNKLCNTDGVWRHFVLRIFPFFFSNQNPSSWKSFYCVIPKMFSQNPEMVICQSLIFF